MPPVITLLNIRSISFTSVPKCISKVLIKFILWAIWIFNFLSHVLNWLRSRRGNRNICLSLGVSILSPAPVSNMHQEQGIEIHPIWSGCNQIGLHQFHPPKVNPSERYCDTTTNWQTTNYIHLQNLSPRILLGRDDHFHYWFIVYQVIN